MPFLHFLPELGQRAPKMALLGKYLLSFLEIELRRALRFGDIARSKYAQQPTVPITEFRWLRKLVEHRGQLWRHGKVRHYPTLPSRLTPSSFCASTANSI